jgi:hypothetical protein
MGTHLFATFKTYIFATFAAGVVKPGIFLQSAVVFFGPSIILLLYHLPRVLAYCLSRSVGSALFLLLGLAMLINSESRVVTFAYPMIVVSLTATLQERGIRRSFLVVFVICSLLVSKVYLPLNQLGIAATLRKSAALLEFPWQWVFMNYGPWTGWSGYVLNGALVAVAILLLLPFDRRPMVRKDRIAP